MIVSEREKKVKAAAVVVNLVERERTRETIGYKFMVIIELLRKYGSTTAVRLITLGSVRGGCYLLAEVVTSSIL